MTEAEAKTKWCPFVHVMRESESRHAMTTRGQSLSPDAEPLAQQLTCIGSACMAWRPITKFSATHGRIEKPNEGYCGLAGRPE